MSLTSWSKIGSIIQGDIAITLEKGKVYPEYVELYITAYSSKWSKANISIEYKNDDQWKKDTNIVYADCEYIKGNKLYGLSTSKNGYLNIIRWKYSSNFILQGDIPEVKIKILPYIKQSSYFNNIGILSELYEKNKVNYLLKTNGYKILGINNDSQYIAYKNNNIYIFDSFDSSYIYNYSGILNSSHAIQINSGNYIIVDTGNDRIIELSNDLSTLLNSYSISNPNFVDYCEKNETLLVTGTTPNKIYELMWGYDNYGTLIWNSNISLNNPSCATYSKNNKEEIIIADTNNNRIVIYDKLYKNYKYIDYCSFGNGYNENEDKIVSFYKPYRVYKLYDNKICIIEKNGKPITFESLDYSSSSSSSSIDSSSSSSSSSSSEGYSESSSSSSELYSESSESSSSEGYSSSSESSSSSELYSESSESSSSELYSESSSSSSIDSSSSSSSFDERFIFKINLTSPDLTFTMPTETILKGFVNWGDGTINSNTSHTYSSDGEKTIEVIGGINGFRFNNLGDRLKIIDVLQWGNFEINSDRYFYGCSNLNITAIDSPNITTTDMTLTFKRVGSTSDKTLNISHWDLSGVENIRFMFHECYHLTNIDVSDWDVSNITNFDSVFRNCERATTIDISNWVTTSVTIMSTMFGYCKALTSLDLTHFDVSNVTKIENFCYDCDNLINVNLSGWDARNIQNMEELCYSCNNLETVDFSNWITSGNLTDMHLAFTRCPNLKELIGFGNIDITGMTTIDFNIYATDSTLDTQSYNEILIGFANQNVNNNLSLSVGNSRYEADSEAETARNYLTGTKGWSIADGGADTTISSSSSSS